MNSSHSTLFCRLIITSIYARQFYDNRFFTYFSFHPKLINIKTLNFYHAQIIKYFVKSYEFINLIAYNNHIIILPYSQCSLFTCKLLLICNYFHWSRNLNSSHSTLFCRLIITSIYASAVLEINTRRLKNLLALFVLETSDHWLRGARRTTVTYVTIHRSQN